MNHKAYYIKLPIHTVISTQEAIDHAESIDDRPRPNGTPFIPYNQEDQDIFEGHWCHQCRWEKPNEAKYCDIHAGALMGEIPNEWVYANNKPMCIMWEKRNG